MWSSHPAHAVRDGEPVVEANPDALSACSMDVNVFIEPKVDLARLAQALDDIGHPGRVWAMKKWTKSIQSRLFDAADGFRPLDLEFFVPSDRGPLEEVIHHGHNTLPAFNSFQKRFCKPSAGGETGVLYGYNHNPKFTGMMTGPGYYVAHPSETPGLLAVDYTRTPPEKPESWPAIVPSASRLGLFVYGGMIDYMRGISKHISIGRAFKGGRYIDAWFVLCREDATSA
jgi:hypothetical protein